MDDKYKEIVSKKLKQIADGYLDIDDQTQMYRAWSVDRDLTGLQSAVNNFWAEVPEGTDELSNKINNKGVKGKIKQLITLIKSNIKICKSLNNFDTKEYTEDLNFVIGMENVVITRTITKDEKKSMNIINKKHLTIQRILDVE
tara:strand:+ start:213 stop:641 length:429 start_codon:yes stop_codon:yes gene_type:complete